MKSQQTNSELSHVRVKDDTLNTDKNLRKIENACDIALNVTRKAGNIIINMSSAAFLIVQDIINSNINKNCGPRSLTYTIDKDNSGSIVQDIYRIKDWNAVTAVLAEGNVGACRVTLNLFRTTASAMINSRDAEALYDNVRQMLEIVAGSKKASTLNRQMRAVLAVRIASRTPYQKL